MLKIYKTLLWSNIPIAFDAVGWTGLTFNTLKIEHNYVMFILAFTFTWLFYTKDRIEISASDLLNNPERSEWYATQKHLKTLMLLALVPIIICLLMRSSIILPCLIAVIPCVVYTKKVTIGKRKFSLKDLPGMKAILVSFLWVVLTVIFPSFSTHPLLSHKFININLSLMVGWFVMLQIHTNDIRDIEGDTKEHTKSFAVLLGNKNARFLGVFLIVLGTYFGWGLLNTSMLIFFSFILTIRTLFYNKEQDIYWQAIISSQGLLAYLIL